MACFILAVTGGRTAVVDGGAIFCTNKYKTYVSMHVCGNIGGLFVQEVGTSYATPNVVLYVETYNQENDVTELMEQ